MLGQLVERAPVKVDTESASRDFQTAPRRASRLHGPAPAAEK